MRAVGGEWIRVGKETLKDISQLLWKHGVVKKKKKIRDSENVTLPAVYFLIQLVPSGNDAAQARGPFS